MDKVKIVLQALTGYIGSSQNPEAISTRFVGIALGVVTFVAPYIASVLGVGAEYVVAQVQPICYFVAVVWWVVGAIKAVWTALKSHPVVGAWLK